MKRTDRKLLVKGFIDGIVTVVVYIGIILGVLGLIFTFVDVMQFPIVQDFIYHQFWHAMAFLVVSIFYLHRMVRYLFREGLSLLRDYAGHESYEQRIEKENLELKEENLELKEENLELKEENLELKEELLRYRP